MPDIEIINHSNTPVSLTIDGIDRMLIAKDSVMIDVDTDMDISVSAMEVIKRGSLNRLETLMNNPGVIDALRNMGELEEAQGILESLGKKPFRAAQTVESILDYPQR